jgi:hypothetical protein
MITTGSRYFEIIYYNVLYTGKFSLMLSSIMKELKHSIFTRKISNGYIIGYIYYIMDI